MGLMTTQVCQVDNGFAGRQVDLDPGFLVLHHDQDSVFSSMSRVMDQSFSLYPTLGTIGNISGISEDLSAYGGWAVMLMQMQRRSKQDLQLFSLQ